MLKLSTLFHLNLMYSSIPIAARCDVIRRCYHPLLDLAEQGVPLAVEATGLTLELIADHDPAWLKRLRGLLRDGRVEYVGSGYSQIIGPLAPAPVNARNLALGRDTARRLLDCDPTFWLVNEMAWSGGLVALYREAGARAVIVEWNNARRAHPEWDAELRFHRQRALGPDGDDVPLIWIDTIDFQKLQRLATGEIEPRELESHWRDRIPAADQPARHAMFYGSDAEVFDYRPGRYRQEDRSPPTGEWERIAAAAADLDTEPDLAFVPLASWLDDPPSPVCDQPLRLEATAQPVVVKKQEKYNLNRWAVTGRGDLELNTTCQALASTLETETDDERWRDLLRLWSSDLRTHLTAERWAEVEPRLRSVELPAWKGEPSTPVLTDNGDLELATDGAVLRLNPRRGLALRSLHFAALGPQPVLGTLNLGYFDDIALGADFYTGHAVVQRPGRAKLTDLQSAAANVSTLPDGTLVAAAEIADDDLCVRKEWAVSPGESAVRLRGFLRLPARRAGEIHPVHLTVVPGLFDAARLGFAVCNGGRSREVFRLGDDGVHHGEAYSTLITAKGGLGATDGMLLLGDEQRRLVIRHDPSVSALMPTVRFVPGQGAHRDRYFLRVRYSAQEVDETFVENDRPWQLAWSLIITAEQRGLGAS